MDDETVQDPPVNALLKGYPRSKALIDIFRRPGRYHVFFEDEDVVEVVTVTTGIAVIGWGVRGYGAHAARRSELVCEGWGWRRGTPRATQMSKRTVFGTD